MLRTPARRRSTVLSIAVVATLGVLIFGASSAAAAPVITEVRNVDWTLVLIGVVMSAAAIWNRGLMNQAAHGAVGIEAATGEMTRVAAVAFSAQKLLKSGGASGLAVFVHHGRRHDRAAPDVTAACMLVAVAAFAALGLAMGTTIGVLAASGRLTGWWLLASAGFAVYGVLVVALIALARRQRSAIDRCWMFVNAAGRRVRRRPRRVPKPLPIDDVFSALSAARQQPADLRRTVVHAVVSKAAGAAMLFVAARGAGLQLSPTQALVAYAIVLSTSLVAFVPGGFGVVEASTAALLIAGGASASSAALAITLFRVFDLWIPFGVGLLAAKGQFRRPEAPVEIEACEPVPLARPLAHRAAAA